MTDNRNTATRTNTETETMKTRSIGPHDMLAAGTMIRVGNKRGSIVSCDYVPAQPCGMIALHTIHLTDRMKRDYGKVWHWEPIEEKPRTINYSLIYVAA